MPGQSRPLKSGYKYTLSILLVSLSKTLSCSVFEISGLAPGPGVGSAIVVATGTVATGCPLQRGGIYNPSSSGVALGVTVGVTVGELVGKGVTVGLKPSKADVT